MKKHLLNTFLKGKKITMIEDFEGKAYIYFDDCVLIVEEYDLCPMKEVPEEEIQEIIKKQELMQHV